MKKTWIKLRRTLLEPKHVRAIGNRIWVYLYMLDHVDWDTGMLDNWRDQDAADALGIPKRVVRDQRQGLQAAGYIDCQQGYHKLAVKIDKWQSPTSRDNGDTDGAPLFNDGDTHGDTHGDTAAQDLPLSHTPHTTQEIPRLRNHQFDVENYPANVQDVILDICEVWGHKPPKKQSRYFSMWIKGANELQEACGEFPPKQVLAGVRERWEADGGTISITGPMSLVNLAREEAARRRSKPIGKAGPMTDTEWRRRLREGTLEVE